MKNTKSKRLIIIIIGMLGNIKVFADNEIDARIAAMGGAGITTASPYSAYYYNPAMLADNQNNQFSFSLLDLGLDASPKDALYIVNKFDDIDNDLGKIENLTNNLQDKATQLENSASQLEDTVLFADPRKILDDVKKAEELTNTLNNNTEFIDSTLNDFSIKANNVVDNLQDLQNKLNFALDAQVSMAVAYQGQKISFSPFVNYNGDANFNVHLTDIDLQKLQDIVKDLEEVNKNSSEISKQSKELSLTIDKINECAKKITTDPNCFNAIVGGIARYENIRDNILQQAKEAQEKSKSFNGDIENELTSSVDGGAIIYSEAGISGGYKFNLTNQQVLAIGLTPKIQQGNVNSFNLNIKDAMDIDKLDDDNIKKHDFSHFNLDLGLLYSYNNLYKAGLVIKNLSQFKKDIYYSNGSTDTAYIPTQISVGTSYNKEKYLLTSDLDLISYKTFKNNKQKNQNLSLGGEYIPLKFIALRAGYKANIANSKLSVFTGGFGLNLSAFRMSLSAMAGNKVLGTNLTFGFIF